MKKLFLLVLVVVLALVGWWWLKRQAHHEVEMTALVPADTIFFAQVSDIPRSEDRWKGTEIAQILAEPAMQDFLKKPLGSAPKQSQQAQDDWGKIQPVRGYLALTKLNGNLPVASAGFEYQGDRKTVEDMLAKAKDELKKAAPEGRADLLQYNGVTIETYAMSQATVATAFVNNWLFATDDVDEMKATLDRFNGKSAAGVLEAADAFKTCLAQMPKETDTLFYFVPKEVVSRLKMLMLATGQSVNQQGFDKLDKVLAIAGTTKIEGPVMRDTFFSYAPDLPLDGALEKHAMALTSAGTLMFFSSVLQWPDKLTLPDPATDVTGYGKLLEGLQAGLAAQGVSLEDALKAFSPEGAFSVDWTDGTPYPSALVTLDVKDHTKAQKVLELIAGGAFGQAWPKTSENGVDYYGMPSDGFSFLKPTLALSDRFFVAGVTYSSVKEALDSAKATGNKLDQSTDYKTALDSVKPASFGFGYVDTKRLVDKVYGQLRPLIMMYAGFSKEASDYMDASKLPEAAVISKHLTPIIYSSSKVAGGSLVESVGPVTMPEAAVGLGAIGGAIAIPFVKNYLPALNGLSSHSVSTPATPPTSASTPGTPGLPNLANPAPSATAAPETSAMPAGSGN
ncbi:MAG: hypothetical protein QM796_01500 [Chthoniobacteraceae bacterium]